MCVCLGFGIGVEGLQTVNCLHALSLCCEKHFPVVGPVLQCQRENLPSVPLTESLWQALRQRCNPDEHPEYLPFFLAHGVLRADRLGHFQAD